MSSEVCQLCATGQQAERENMEGGDLIQNGDAKSTRAQAEAENVQ